jgi:hypothetical protein
MNNWENYCRVAYDTLRSQRKNWEDENMRRPITRLWYTCVHACGTPNPNPPLISESALIEKSQGASISDDHCYAPEKRCYMIMDMPGKFLADYTEFKTLFYESTRTIKVSKHENKLLSKMKDIPVHLRYKEAGIVLRERVGRRWTFEDTEPYKNNVLEQIPEFVEYEAKYILE